MHVLDHQSSEHVHDHITAFDSMEQALALIAYLAEHNKSHTEELHEICHKLEASGKADAAEYVDKAVDAFRDGNELLDKALELLKQPENVL